MHLQQHAAPQHAVPASLNPVQSGRGVPVIVERGPVPKPVQFNQGVEPIPIPKATSVVGGEQSPFPSPIPRPASIFPQSPVPTPNVPTGAPYTAEVGETGKAWFDLPISHDALYDYSQKLSQKVVKLESENTELKESSSFLKSENEALSERVYALQQENTMLRDMGWNSHLEKTQYVAHAEGAMESQRSEVMRLRGMVAQQKERLDSLVAENGMLQRTVDTLQTERTQLGHTVQGLEVAMDSMQTDVGRRIAAESGLTQQRDGLERKVQQLSAEKVRLDEHVASQHVQVGKLQHALGELQQERTRSHQLAQKLQTVEMEVQRLCQEKAGTDHTISTLHVEVAQLRTGREAMTAELPKLETTVQQQAGTISDLQNVNAQCQRTIHDLHREKSLLEADLQQKRFDLEGLKVTTQKHAHDESSLFGEIQNLKRVLDEMTTKKVQVDERCHALEAERAHLQARLDAHGGEGSQLHQRLQQFSAENTALRSQLMGKEKMVKALEEEATGLKQSLTMVREENDMFQQSVTQRSVDRRLHAPL